MIHVTKQTEPDNFDSLVRQPGKKYLKSNPTPKSSEFEKHAYWRAILLDMHSKYDGICAYSCQHIDILTGNRNVEHFQPKVPFPNQAYEWDNYRLVCGLLNSRKKTKQILDPFIIQDSWFFIAFPSLLIYPSPNIAKSDKDEVQNTIDVLRLNDDDICIPARRRYIDSYCCGDVGFSYLEKYAPFVARELERQDMKQRIKEIWICNTHSRSKPEK